MPHRNKSLGTFCATPSMLVWGNTGDPAFVRSSTSRRGTAIMALQDPVNCSRNFAGSRTLRRKSELIGNMAVVAAVAADPGMSLQTLSMPRCVSWRPRLGLSPEGALYFSSLRLGPRFLSPAYAHSSPRHTDYRVSDDRDIGRLVRSRLPLKLKPRCPSYASTGCACPDVPCKEERLADSQNDHVA